MSFKSYCWSLGTTSFRTGNFISKMERQLDLINEFWKLYPNEEWYGNGITQEKYYDFLKLNDFISGESKNKAKDARQKTSGLVDLGLLDRENRKITNIGYKILEIVRKNDFNRDNIFNIPQDSYIYLLQLIKMQNTNDDFKVKPYLFIVYMLIHLKYLNNQELTYLIPMCKNIEELKQLCDDLKNERDKFNYDDYILGKLMNMSNIQDALYYFLKTNEIDETLFEIIGLNRDGGRHDKPYYNLYKYLYLLYHNKFLELNQRKTLYCELWKAIKGMSKSVSPKWKRFLFYDIQNIEKIDKDFDEKFKNLDINLSRDDKDFKKNFFEKMHLFKCKATLEDYFDLNKRYLSLTETIKFKNNIAELELLPKYFFRNVIDFAIEKDFFDAETYKGILTNNISLAELFPEFNINQIQLLKEINEDQKTSLNLQQLKNYLADKKTEEFRNLIDKKFTNEYLIKLLTKIEERKDSALMKEITYNADIPTIFEYIIGIAWYKISDKEGDILEFLNLTLDNNLLPKVHAKGGLPDIEYKYQDSNYYKKHDLLIEATLTDSTNQRSAEMEPVSRHLGESIKSTNNINNYAIFVAPKLNERLILDFRNMKTRLYPSKKNCSIKGLEKINNSRQKYINGLKIIPITVGILKEILKKDWNYKYIYKIFDEAYKSNISDKYWYNEKILSSFIKNDE